MKSMMIDYRDNNNGNIMRKVIDNYEFCIRDGVAYFVSDGTRYNISLASIIQVYTN